MNDAGSKTQFDIASLRRRLSDPAANELPAGTAPDEPALLNPLAQQIARQFRDENYSPALLIGQIRLLEFVSLLAIGLLATMLASQSAPLGLLVRIAALAAGSAATILLLQLADTYLIPSLRSAARSRKRVATAGVLGFLASAGSLYLLEEQSFSAGAYLLWFAVGILFLLVERQLIAIGIRHWARNGIMERRAVIIGGGEPAKQLARALEQQPDNDIRICGIFDDRGSARSPAVVAGYPKLGTFAELVEFARLARVDMLIIALPATAEARILQLLRKLWVLPVDIRLAAHADRLRFRPRSYSHVGAVPMFDILDKPIRDWDSVAKRTFDIVFSLAALALTWPIMIGAAIAVKASSKGPVFFVQKRHGFNNEVIDVLKFRSMYTELADPTARKAVTKNDPRVTPVGRFLRKSSIDELPQLFNVLRGELSLVGPRPHSVHAQTGDRRYVDVVESYFARHRVKPGVTGWAQINGLRGELDSDEKIRMRTAYDLHYIENWSLLLDLKILFLTPIRLLNAENAY
ncbi:undecaprenyl-phosphate glucose phosphotransferase [Pseudorhizobium endolithicum]|uniref:Undecaprenyl-phosphate glucose phosphotransferase n=1 Tax=Pseudorhizobium endolithicum TaxID=1191678 RepID=A0ABM8PJ82_9HYPH|nr:undecaprenyl-phosphate glucose phosphotransferase [Pseudorhizobium endolithicum]CAD7033093.1 undecaprenyl-phosphate glucose phosphotransferase [Pseudorhizobium endolithicum]